MDKELFSQIASFEKNNWWYQARRDLLNKLLFSKKTVFDSALDAGCGVGSNYTVLANHSKKVYGLDISIDSINYCQTKGYVELYHSSLEEFQASKEFDLITCLDVIEHIKDDDLATRKLYSLLSKNGIIILSVPAFSFLWNINDDFAQHRRRYHKAKMRSLMQNNNFNIERLSYWNQSMFLPVLVYCILAKLKKKKRPINNLNIIPRFFNHFLFFILKIENHFFLHNFVFTGTSVFCVSTKK